jgi:acetyl esterase
MTERLDPQQAAVIEEIGSAGVPPWHSMSVSCARRLEDELFSAGDGPAMETVRDLGIDGPAGELPIRVYRPPASDPATIVFYHGGGWVLGTLDSADDICRELAARTESVVVSVDYRLAPEHPFPAAVEDAYAALGWAEANAEAFGADPGRLAVAGTSAGGNLAGATALRAREEGPDLDGQFLLYPIVDYGFETASYREHAESPLLSRADMEWFWEQYLRSPVDAHNPFVSLSRASDLSGVAPATVVTAGIDVLRDEGADYVRRLAADGVPTEHFEYPSLAHGFLSLTDDVDAAEEAMGELARSIRARLE